MRNQLFHITLPVSLLKPGRRAQLVLSSLSFVAACVLQTIIHIMLPSSHKNPEAIRHFLR